MKRLRALVAKELRQHAAFGAGLAVCLGFLYALLLVAGWFNPEVVSLLWVHGVFVWLLFLIGGFVLGNRLVVAEYFGRTQLFVEALPMRRWEMVALKFGFGLAVLWSAAGLSLAVTALAALSREPLDARFLGFVALRTAVFLFFGWSFLFAMGFIGRFRVPLYFAILLMVIVVDSQTSLELAHFGPSVVLDVDSLPVERETLPVRALVETSLLGLLWTAVAFVLALIHEGSIAEALARRMSQREKALVGILFVGFVLAFSLLEEHRVKEPYTFPADEAVVAGAELPIEILYLLPERRDDAEALLQGLESLLAPLAQDLGWSWLPDVRVAYGPSLDAGTYDRAELRDSDGLLVRANFRRSESWDERDFHRFLTGLVLDEATADRADFEPKAWLRDGFASWWSWNGRSRETARPFEGLGEACAARFVPVLRALWTSRGETLDAPYVAAWHRRRERHGETMAEAVAFSGLLVLEERHGRAAVMDLARQVFGRSAPESFRELFYEWRHPMPAVFQASTGISWDELLATWQAELDRLRGLPACAAALAEVPDGEATIEVEAGQGSVRNLVYRYRFDRPPRAGTLVRLLHRRLSPFDAPIEPRDLRRIEKLWPEGAREASWRLPGQYGQGSRAFLALEVDSDLLAGPIRLHAERREIR